MSVDEFFIHLDALRPERLPAVTLLEGAEFDEQPIQRECSRAHDALDDLVGSLHHLVGRKRQQTFVIVLACPPAPTHGSRPPRLSSAQR